MGKLLSFFTALVLICALILPESLSVSAKDSFEYADMTSQICFKGVWTSVSNKNFIGKSAMKTKSGGTAGFVISGGDFEIISYKSKTQGKLYVSIDKGQKTEIDLYENSTDTAFKKTVYSSNNLSSGAHTVEISTSGNVYIDEINANGSISPYKEKLTKYEAEEILDKAETSGQWSEKNVWKFSNHIALQGGDGSSFSFGFTGCGFAFISYKSRTQGKLYVSIDGEYAGTADLYEDSTDISYNAEVFRSETLDNKQHTAEITVSGKAYLDAIILDGTITEKAWSGPEDENSNINPLTDWEYTLDEKNMTVSLTKYIGTTADVGVASSYIVNDTSYSTLLNCGYTQPASTASAFSENTVVERLYLENGVAAIGTKSAGYRMFNGCSNLQSVSGTLPSNITSLYQGFYNCSSLTEVCALPNSVTTLQQAFQNCSALSSLPDLSSLSLSSTGSLKQTFQNCTSLKSPGTIHIPSAVDTLYQTFYGCSSLGNTVFVVESSKVSNITNLFVNAVGIFDVFVPTDSDTYKTFALQSGTRYYILHNGLDSSTSITNIASVNPAVSIFGHRGVTGVNVPESSIAAFELAVQSGATVLEMDIRKTSDGVFVISHNSDISTISNGSGNIGNMTLSQLNEYSFNKISQGTSTFYSEEYKDNKILTLEKFLQWNTTKKKNFQIQISWTSATTEEITSLINLIKQYNLLNYVSVEVDTMEQINIISSIEGTNNVRYGFMSLSEASETINRINIALSYVDNGNHLTLITTGGSLTDEVLEYAMSNNVNVMLYSYNTEDISSWIAKGVTGFAPYVGYSQIADYLHAQSLS